MDQVAELLADIAPGDRLDFDEIDASLRASFVEEFEGQGYTLSSDGIVGQIEICHTCDGDGQLPGGRECKTCLGFSNIVDWGKGWKPYRE